MLRPLFAAAISIALAGCATKPLSDPSLTWVRLGESAVVDGPTIRPLGVISDSRCPAEVQCAWAGELRIAVKIGNDERNDLHELVLGKPEPVADGALELVEARPYPKRGEAIDPQEYRLGFRFWGGL